MSLIILNDEKKGPWFIYGHESTAKKDGTYFEKGSLNIQIVEGLNGARFLCYFDDCRSFYLAPLRTYFQETLSKVEHVNHEYIDNEFLPPLREKLRDHYLLPKGSDDDGVERLSFSPAIASKDGIFQIEGGAYAFKKHFLYCDNEGVYAALSALERDPTPEDLVAFLDFHNGLNIGGVIVHYPSIRGYLEDEVFTLRDGNLNDHPLDKEVLICQ